MFTFSKGYLVVASIIIPFTVDSDFTVVESVVFLVIISLVSVVFLS